MKRREEIVNKLVNYFMGEDEGYCNIGIPSTYEDKRYLLKGLINMRGPYQLSEDILSLEDELLNLEQEDEELVDIDDLSIVDKNIYLWRGDITTIKSDIIVNAGNNAGLGCFDPTHTCIDNVIHTHAGIRLRLECDKVLDGGFIENGDFIICDSYNLPCKKVITTVGPCINGLVSDKDRIELSNCYKNSLKYAIDNGYKSIVYPCISTGLFSFPISEAKVIAYQSVKEVIGNNDIKVIFNVFSERDYNEYREMF